VLDVNEAAVIIELGQQIIDGAHRKGHCSIVEVPPVKLQGRDLTRFATVLPWARHGVAASPAFTDCRSDPTQKNTRRRRW